jgi:hypothetical protein
MKGFGHKNYSPLNGMGDKMTAPKMGMGHKQMPISGGTRVMPKVDHSEGMHNEGNHSEMMREPMGMSHMKPQPYSGIEKKKKDKYSL